MPDSEKLIPSELPAGHPRNEAKQRVKDDLEARIDANAETEAIDPAKLNQRDNEILRHVVEGGPETGSIPVENAQQGWRYGRFTVADGFGSAARANIRSMHEAAKLNGWRPVSGEDTEDERFKGNDCAGGSSLRGVGDTILMKIREEDYQRMLAKSREKQRREGAIEEQSLILAERHGVRTMHAVAGDFNQDPMMARVAGDAGREETYRMRTTITEGDLRRGSMRGPDGRVLQPGYETRMR